MASSEKSIERGPVVMLLNPVARTVVLMFLLHAVVFVVFDLLPEATFSRLGIAAINPRTLEETRAHMGLSGSATTRYVRSLSNVVSGDLGKSIQSDYPVTQLLLERAWVSLPIVVLVIVLCFVVTVLAARWYSTPRLSILQRWLLIIGPAALAPQFATAATLAVCGSLGIFSGHVGSWLPALLSETLFVLSIALMPAAILFMAAARSAQDVMGRKFVLTYQAIGFSWPDIRRLIQPNILRAMLPIGTRVSLTVATGTVFAELSFNRPGIGAVLADAVRSGDQPVAAGWMVAVAVPLVLISQLLAAINKRLPTS